MPERDLELLLDAARAAGEVALGYTGKTAKRWEKPDGAGPVTEADLAVNLMLEKHLRAARPDYGWLSEESDDGKARLDHKRVFIIDPIDGTRSFADGSDIWAHSIAIAENGRPIAAVVYLPARNKMFAAAQGAGAFLNGSLIRVAERRDIAGAEMLTTRPNMDASHWRRSAPPDVRRSHRPSLAYRMALVAQGKFDAMLTLRPAWEWDIAAGDLILREAGAVVTDRRGNPLQFNNAHPAQDGVIAANPAIHQQVLSALRQI